MLSKNPLDLTPPDKKFSKDKVAEALRLSIIAELDAINLYLQLADKIEDERFRRVFLDIAREEKTHVGEFLALLKNLDPEQIAELKAGAEEVEELTGIKMTVNDPAGKGGEEEKDVGEGVFTGAEWSRIIREFVDRANRLRVFRKNLPLTVLGAGVDYAPIYRYGEERVGVKKLCEIGLTVKIPQRLIDSARRTGETPALEIFLEKAVELGNMENDIILKGCEGSEGIMNTSGVQVFTISDWETVGSAIEEIGRALSLFSEKNIVPPYKLFLSPRRYVKLLKVHERVGVIELERIRRMVDDIIVTNSLPDDTALLIASSPDYIDIVVGRDTNIQYVGPENGVHIYYINETITSRIKKPEAIIILREKKE